MILAQKILGFLPVPFWVYFLSILASAVGILPHESPVYGLVSRHFLPASIILMLLGTPLSDLMKMGRTAATAMGIGTASIFFAQILGYVIFLKFLPSDGWKSVGALMGTWIGGSANMVAVKEILGLPDAGLSPLVIVDTILSYAWMGGLLAAVRFQPWFDRSLNGGGNVQLAHEKENTVPAEPTQGLNWKVKLRRWTLVLTGGFIIGEATILIGKFLAIFFQFLSVSGWILLAASTVALFLALTPLRSLKGLGSSEIGTILLYCVLVTIGARTNLSASVQSPVFLLYGVVVFLMHGFMMLGLGRILNIPLFLLSTASQANIGGAVSAPIVAQAYRSGTAHVGVLMGVLGAVVGTYLGVVGGYICRALGSRLLGTPL